MAHDGPSALRKYMANMYGQYTIHAAREGPRTTERQKPVPGPTRPAFHRGSCQDSCNYGLDLLLLLLGMDGSASDPT
jgi:hypothetical protein